MLEKVPEIAREDVRAVLERLRGIQGSWPNEMQLTFHAQDSAYNYHPHLFLEAFPGVAPEPLRDLSLAALLISSAVCVRDRVLDGHAGSDVVRATLRIQAMELEAYRIFQRHFGPQSQFWARYRDLAAMYSHVNLFAARFINGEAAWSEFTESRAVELANFNSALASSTVDAMAELSGHFEHHADLRQSIAHYNIARQLWDDVCDWKEDLQKRSPTLVIARVFQARPELADRPRDDALFKDFVREAHYRGHVSHVLGLALRHVAAAEQRAAALPNLLWHTLLAAVRGNCEKLQADLSQIISRNLERTRAAAP